jgi:hypothetical protein
VATSKRAYLEEVPIERILIDSIQNMVVSHRQSFMQSKDGEENGVSFYKIKKTMEKMSM